MDNGKKPAMPTAIGGYYDDGRVRSPEDGTIGLTKLELFSAMAMQGFVANSYHGDRWAPLSEATAEEIAEISVDQAKALLAELEKEQ